MSSNDVIQDVVDRVTSQIEGQNWTNDPLTLREKDVIQMAVQATILYEAPTLIIARGEIKRLNQRLKLAWFFMVIMAGFLIWGMI